MLLPLSSSSTRRNFSAGKWRHSHVGTSPCSAQVIANLDDHTNIEDFLKFLLELPKRVDEPSAEFEDTVLRANVSFRLYKKFERCFELVRFA